MLKDLLGSPPPTTTTPLSRSKRPTGAIVGGTIGGLVLVAIICICYFLWRPPVQRAKPVQNDGPVQNDDPVELCNGPERVEAGPSVGDGSPVEVGG